MNKKRENNLSKFMSKILRHDPEKFGLKLANDGTCKINDLVKAINSQVNWNGITAENIEQVVKNCEKQRYTIEGSRIKANYGHSIQKVKYQEKEPPEILYHGTNTNVKDLILIEGIKSMGREYVHMSEGEEFATLAGKRKGELAIINVAAKTAYKDGIKFYYAGNEVWLSEFVPSKYLSGF